MIIFFAVDIISATEGDLQMEKYDFGNKLYEYRTQKGLTQKELGKLLGVTDKAVSKWETGESKPRLDKMTQITMLFETSIDSMLGNEAAENGEQLKPYKTIFDSCLEKYSKYYKTARIWTYIIAVFGFVFSAVSAVGKILSGGLVTERAAAFIVISILTSAAIIFTLKFKPKFSKCENKDMKVFMTFILAQFVAIGTYIVGSAVRTGRITGHYNESIIGPICVEILILAVIALISFLKKKYYVIVIALCAFSAINTFNFSVYYSVIFALAMQFVCFIKKSNWLALVQKADIEIRKSNESQKGANILVTIIAVITAANIIVSSFLPYITYRICLKEYGPVYIHNEAIDYDYSAKFDEEFIEVEIKNAKIIIPKGYEKRSEDEDFVSFSDENYNMITVSYFPKEAFDEILDKSDIDDSDDEIKDFYAMEKVMDKLYQEYYGVSVNTYYGLTYINYFTDLEDIKFYESEKAALLLVTLVMKKVSDTGSPMSVSKFDDGLHCGLISGRKMKLTGDTTTLWRADVWRSNDKEGAYYSIDYWDRNNGDITDNQMICKLVNSLEF